LLSSGCCSFAPQTSFVVFLGLTYPIRIPFELPSFPTVPQNFFGKASSPLTSLKSLHDSPPRFLMTLTGEGLYQVASLDSCLRGRLVFVSSNIQEFPGFPDRACSSFFPIANLVSEDWLTLTSRVGYVAIPPGLPRTFDPGLPLDHLLCPLETPMFIPPPQAALSFYFPTPDRDRECCPLTAPPFGPLVAGFLPGFFFLIFWYSCCGPTIVFSLCSILFILR